LSGNDLRSFRSRGSSAALPSRSREPFQKPSPVCAKGLPGHSALRARVPAGLAGLAEALARQGDHGQALAAAREGLEAQERTGQRGLGSELHRLAGIALFGLKRLDEGQRALEEAMRIARRKEAKAYELRAATSLALLWGEQTGKLGAGPGHGLRPLAAPERNDLGQSRRPFLSSPPKGCTPTTAPIMLRLT
jgi:tetratricopeptide (TPR) repeat protein